MSSQPQAHLHQAADGPAAATTTHSHTQSHLHPPSLPHPHPRLAHHHPSNSAGRPTLPDRDVTAATIEDAYIRFIFYCNPALPPDADAESLREAFRNPPRSGGKLFNLFVIFQLVKKFYNKEIKTWTDLTTRLGVEPPDPNKEESTQKIAQYGVRLKKWMNSMHIKAFFEYLMDIPNDYWTKIPDDPNPLAQTVRDGIPLEDDMSLRALFPHIRPKRGRKRPHAKPLESPAQRLRPSPPSSTHGTPHAWPADPDSQVPSLSMDQAGQGAPWASDGVPPASTSRRQHQAGPPITRSPFWDDALEPPRPSTPPKHPKSLHHRSGAKNVSSAWKPGNWDSGSAKARGRPPMKRVLDEKPNQSVAFWAPTPDSNPAEARETMPVTPNASQLHSPGHDLVSGQPGLAHSQAQEEMTPPLVPLTGPGPAGPLPRPYISRDVPERSGSSAQLATPPMMAVDRTGDARDGGRERQISAAAPFPRGNPQDVQPASGRRQPAHPAVSPPVTTTTVSLADIASATHSQNKESNSNSTSDNDDHENIRATDGAATTTNVGGPQPKVTYLRDIPEWYFDEMEDRINIDPLVSYFNQILKHAEWIDPDGNAQEPASMEECTAMTHATIEHMYKSAESPQAFLINLAALAGGKLLLKGRPRCYRVERCEGVVTYNFSWQYAFGSLRGQFNMSHETPKRRWKKEEAGEEGGRPLRMEQWRETDHDGEFMREAEKRDRQALETQDRIKAPR